MREEQRRSKNKLGKRKRQWTTPDGDAKTFLSPSSNQK